MASPSRENNLNSLQWSTVVREVDTTHLAKFALYYRSIFECPVSNDNSQRITGIHALQITKLSLTTGLLYYIKIISIYLIVSRYTHYQQLKRQK